MSRKLREHSKEEPIPFYRAYLVVRSVADQKRRMPRSSISDDLCIKISVPLSCSDEVLFELSAESLIQTDQNQFGMLSMRLVACKGALQHRSDERGRNAVAGYVGDENTELVAIQHEEIVEVAGDRAHGEIASGDLEASDAGHCPRENRGLDPPRKFRAPCRWRAGDACTLAKVRWAAT
jgi:hypothetical protein